MQMTCFLWRIGGRLEHNRGHFVEACSTRGLKAAGKRKVMVLNGEEGLECEASVDRVRLEHMSEMSE